MTVILTKGRKRVELNDGRNTNGYYVTMQTNFDTIIGNRRLRRGEKEEWTFSTTGYTNGYLFGIVDGLTMTGFSKTHDDS